MPATHVRCLECATLTKIEEFSGVEDTYCPVCDGNGQDPWCTEALAISPCPNDPPENCVSDSHHWGTGMHEVNAETGQ